MLGISSNGVVTSGFMRVTEAEGETIPAGQEVAAKPCAESMRVSHESGRQSPRRAYEKSVAVCLQRHCAPTNGIVRRDLTPCALHVRIQV